jgi:hypothetical protein
MLHTDGLIGCAFLENTHQVVSTAKDSLNFYDADIHQRYLTVKAHVEGGATCMATGGLHVATAGRDQTLRLFSRTDEVLVLSDEREQEREKEIEKEAKLERPEVPSLQNAETEKETDKLIEAIDIFKTQPTNCPLMAAYGAKTYNEFMLKILSGIKAADLEASIIMLPVAYVHAMVPVLIAILETYPLATELVIRTMHTLMKFHLPAVSFVKKDILKKMASLSKERVNELVHTVGFNLAGLKFINNAKMEKEMTEEFQEILSMRKRRKKNKEKALKRALLTVQAS